MADTPGNHNSLITAIVGGIAGIGVGVVTGVWWGRRVTGHIYRDGHDWYVDEPVLRELQRRIHWSGGMMWQGGYYFSLLGHGGIKLVPTQRTLPEQSGALYAVEPMLRQGHELEVVMLDLATHRVGKLKLIRYTPRQTASRMVQGPDVEPADRPVGEVPPGPGSER